MLKVLEIITLVLACVGLIMAILAIITNAIDWEVFTRNSLSQFETNEFEITIKEDTIDKVATVNEEASESNTACKG